MGQEAVRSNDAIARFKRGGCFLVDKPLEFVRDPDTGNVAIVWLSSFHALGGPRFETPMGLLLTTEIAQALLADLPVLEALLREATQTPTKPPYVQ
jgi:hypothetical protein